MDARKFLVTGAAGFIGFHLARRLLGQGHDVVGLDNFDPFYDVGLKRARVADLAKAPNFHLAEIDLADRQAMEALFAQHRFDRVIHLAGQAGVRYSLVNPHAFPRSNMVGFLHLLEGAAKSHVGHVIYASSSSVYGANTKQPFAESDVADHPISLYAASKKANELMAHAYAHQFDLPLTGLRFFTVYGPWGRPDMALYTFAKAIVEDRVIELHEAGAMKRDFTYVDDVVEAILRLIDHVPTRADHDVADRPDISQVARHRVYNIGNDRPELVSTYLNLLEGALGRKAKVQNVAMKPGEVMATWADITALKAAIGYAPSTPIAEGIAHFVAWFKTHHNV